MRTLLDMPHIQRIEWCVKLHVKGKNVVTPLVGNPSHLTKSMWDDVVKYRRGGGGWDAGLGPLWSPVGGPFPMGACQ
jgi:hypothetical protein